MHGQELEKMINASTLSFASQNLIKERALQKRIDSKFLFHTDAFKDVLTFFEDEYALVKAKTRYVADYQTLYLDTDDFCCLRDHHRGCRPRYKFRFRHYADRETTFFEVKTKTPANRTRKKRMQVEYRQEDLGPEQCAFVEKHSPMQASMLKAALRIDFSRVMLVGVERMERVTFDINFRVEEGSRRAAFPQVVIAELKQEHFIARSPMMLALRSYGHRISSMSKYCVASMLMRPEVLLQRYKPTLRALRRIS